jgi:fluoroquinolone transport system permease protein
MTIFRDSFMAFILSIPLFVATLFRFIMPVLQNFLIQYFDLSNYYDFITIFVLVMGPMMSGMVIGFNLLDDRDEDILSYMAITPIRKEGYLLFKVFAPMVAAVIQSQLILLIFNPAHINFWRVQPLIFILAMETPVYALIMASLAGNKVEGLAIGKLLGVSLIGPFVSYFWLSKMKYISGILPTFWICESYFASGSFYHLFLIIGLIYHILLLRWTLRRFIQKSN